MRAIIIVLFLVGFSFADFYQDGIYNNHWLWFHVGAGAVLTLALHKVLGVNPTMAVVYVCALAVSWEVLEYFTNLDSYRDTTHFLNDSLGDIAGAGCASISIRIFL